MLSYAGVDVNTTNDLGETALFSAIIHKNLDCINLLVENGCDIDAVWQKSTALYLTLVNQDLATASHLIAKGAQITKLPGLLLKIGRAHV